MYEQKHFDLPTRVANEKHPAVAFYGNKVRATDSFRLIEIEANGEPHEPVCYDASRLKAIKLKKGEVLHQEQFGLVPLETKFPDVDKLINDDWNKKEYFEFSVNGKYLAEFVAQMAKLSKFNKVIIQIPKKWVEMEKNAAEPMKVISEDRKMTGYLMPLNK